MSELLVVVDMQNDFIDGSLGTKEAQEIVDYAVRKIKNFDGNIFVTQDTHYEKNYPITQEGRRLPILHCINRSYGHMLNKDISEALKGKKVTYTEKSTFGSLKLIEYLKDNHYDEITFIGLCTDICVVSNALLCKAHFPEINLSVDSRACAGTTPENHKHAIETMRSCQIEIY